MIDKNEVKKDLYKSKNMAILSHYVSGNIYYNVVLTDGLYQFPIPVVEAGPTINTDESGLSMYEIETVKLSEDLGTTTFHQSMKGSDLNRWISKAIDKEEFTKIG